MRLASRLSDLMCDRSTTFVNTIDFHDVSFAFVTTLFTRRNFLQKGGSSGLNGRAGA